MDRLIIQEPVLGLRIHPDIGLALPGVVDSLLPLIRVVQAIREAGLHLLLPRPPGQEEVAVHHDLAGVNNIWAEIPHSRNS